MCDDLERAAYNRRIVSTPLFIEWWVYYENTVQTLSDKELAQWGWIGEMPMVDKTELDSVHSDPILYMGDDEEEEIIYLEEDDEQ